MPNEGYVPGVCNIGPAEIRRRRASGWAGLTAGLALAAGCFAFNVPAVWRTAVFFPATLAASGFLQAAQRFCAGFGLKSAFNFGPLGRTESVADSASRAMDRRKALAVIGKSVAIGLAAAALAYWI